MSVTPFRIDMIYNKCQEHDDNIFLFNAFACELGLHRALFFPNWEKQPWLVQCKIGAVTVNFWPHKNKCSIQCNDFHKEYIGYSAVRDLVIKMVRTQDEIVKLAVDRLMAEGVLA